ncbi:MAG: ARMT1-like domain-containing protein, partial [Ignavibacteriaceae bacterium]
MSIQTGCIPCIVKQAYSFSKLAGISDVEIQKQILFETMNKLQIHKNIKTSPHFSIILQSIISKYTDINKIYREIKSRNVQRAMKYINYLTHMIEASDDKLELAVRASIAGNTIDLAANPNFDIEKEINVITSNNINLDFFPKFKEDLHKAKTILFIGDNYEEALFDKLLIKQLLPKEIVFAVRSNEILNDITMEDAKRLEIDKFCKLIESGNVIAGIDLEECSGDFLDSYNSADMIIAKGQGN